MNAKLLSLVLFGLAQGVPAATNLEFVVIGDTRPRFESEDYRAFQSLIPKINEANPALVINLGDMIYGYGLRRKERQWDRYQAVLKALEPPYHQVPGNHDVFSKDAREIYARRFGRFYDSLDHGDCHLVLLNTCEEGRWGYVGAAQLAWLKRDLQSTPARSVFVFTHFPVWETGRVAPKYYAFWRDTLHPLFLKSRVKAVFGGHAHCYGPTREFDGIRYFVTGGGGAELLPEYRRAGGEHHFLKVRCAADSFDVRVVGARGEWTDPEADLMGGFLFAEKYSSRIGITRGAQDPLTGVPFQLDLHNPHKLPLIGEAVWELDRDHFAVTPGATSVRIPPNQTARFLFTLKALKPGAPLGALPWLRFNLAAGEYRHRFYRQALFLDSLQAPFRASPPTLDGRTSDWPASPLRLLPGPGQATAQVRSSHNRTNLYLAVEVPVNQEPLAEDSAFEDQLQIGFAARSSETGFGGETVRLGLRTAGGRVEVGDRTPGQRLGDPLPGVSAAARINGEQIVFELVIPMRLLPPSSGTARDRKVLSISYPVSGQDHLENSEPTPGSFAYQIRFGGDALVPVHFVELILEKAR